MKKSPRAPRDRQPLPRDLSNRELSTVTGGTTAAPTTTNVGNKVWSDDWLAPV